MVEGTALQATRHNSVWESKCRENYAGIMGQVAPKKLEDVIDGLEAHFEDLRVKKGRELLQCSVCFGRSPDDLDECPFCGTGEEEEKEQPLAMAVGSDVAPAAASGVVMVDPSDTIADDFAAQADSAEPSPSTVIDASAIVASGVELEPPPSPRRRKSAAGTTQVDLTERTPRKAPPVPAPSTPALSLLAGGRATFSEKELDEAVAEFKAETTKAAASAYKIGHLLARIRDQLWMLRRSENGKPKYKNFERFLEEELGISKTQGYDFLRVADTFPPDVAAKYPIKVLSAIARAPKQDHPRLLGMHDEGVSARSIDQEVKEIREKKAHIVSETGNTRAAEAAGKTPQTRAATVAAAQKRKAEAPAITIGLKHEAATIRLIARPKRADKGVERPAKTIADEPYGVLECAHGVKMTFLVRAKPSGELELRVIALKEKKD